MMSSGTPVPTYPKPGSFGGIVRYHAAPICSAPATATNPTSPGRIHPDRYLL